MGRGADAAGASTGGVTMGAGRMAGCAGGVTAGGSTTMAEAVGGIASGAAAGGSTIATGAPAAAVPLGAKSSTSSSSSAWELGAHPGGRL